MALTTTVPKRVFSYGGAELPDPGVRYSPDQVRDIYSASFPEITTAVIEGPVVKGGKIVYEFRKAAGTKG